MTKIRKLMAIALALAMTTAMFAGCSNETTPTSDTSSSESSSVAETPAEPIKATGVVKEMSMTELVVTLDDGSDVTLKVEGLEGLADIALGDTIEVEYTEGEDGAVAASVKATAKAEEDATAESSAAESASSAPDAQNPTSSVSEAQAPAGGTPATSQPAASHPAAQTQTPAAGNIGSTKSVSGMTDKERAEALFDDWEVTVYDWETPAVEFTAAMNTYSFIDADANVLAIVEKLDYNFPEALKTYGYDHYQNGQIGLAKAFNDARGVETICGDIQISPEGVSSHIYNPATDTFSDEWTFVSDILSGKVSSKPADKADNGTTSGGKIEESSGSKVEKPANENKDNDTGSSASESLDDAIRLVNEHRVANGLSELVVNDDLMKLAAVRAEELTENYSHTRPDGTSVTGSFGYGEIITKRDTADAAIQSWKDSSAHNKIMLDDYGSIGVGYCGGYWAMLFGA